MLLAAAGLDAFLETRIEVGTPITAAARYREALQLGWLGLSPYAGGVFHGPPLVLAAVQTVDWILNALMGRTAIGGMGTVLEAPLRTMMTSAVDIAAAWALKSLAHSVLSRAGNRLPTSIVRPDTLPALYLWNPLVVAAAVGGSSGGLENVAVFAALAAAARGNTAMAALATAGASYLGLHPVLLTVPIILLLWRGVEPLAYDPPPPLPQSAKPAGSAAGDSLPANMDSPNAVLPAATAQSNQSGDGRLRIGAEEDTACPALQASDHLASLNTKFTSDSLPSNSRPMHAAAASTSLAEPRQQSHRAQPFAELSQLRLAKTATTRGREPTLEVWLPEDCVSYPGAISAFGSPVETAGPTSPISSRVLPAGRFGSPVDIPEGFLPLRLSTPLASKTQASGQNLDARGTVANTEIGDKDMPASIHGKQATHDKDQCQSGTEDSSEDMLLPHPLQQAGIVADVEHHQPDTNSSSENWSQTKRAVHNAADPHSHRQHIRDSFNHKFHQRRRPGGIGSSIAFVAWLVALGAVLAELSDVSLRTSPGHCHGVFTWLTPSPKQHCSGGGMDDHMRCRTGIVHPHWSRHVYGTMLVVDDLTPNIGLHWYFFAEMFEVFRPLWHFVFAAVAAAAVVPIAIRLPHRPLMVATVQSCAAAMMKPYPSVTDVAQYLALLPLLGCQLEGGGFPLAALVAVGALVAALGPPMWHMWVYFGSANANFYYAVTLAFGAWQAILILWIVTATVRSDRVLAGKSLARW